MLEYRVEKETLKKPISIKCVKKDGAGSEARIKGAEALIKYLKMLQIKFAVVETNSFIEIFVEVESLQD